MEGLGVPHTAWGTWKGEAPGPLRSCQKQGGGRETREPAHVAPSPKVGTEQEDQHLHVVAEHRLLVVKGGEDALGQVAVRLGGQKEFDRTEQFCGVR